MSTSERFLATTAAVLALSLAAAGGAEAGEISPLSPRFQAAMEAARTDDTAAAAAEPAPVPTSRIRVKYRTSAMADEPGSAASVDATIADAGTARVGERVPGPTGTETVILDRPLSQPQLERLAESVAENPAVEWAVPEKIEEVQLAGPSDPRAPEQWDLFEAAAGIKLDEAATLATGSGVVVAVIDTGILPHEDLDGQALPGFDFIEDAARAVDGDGRDADPSDPGDWCPSHPVPISSWHGLHVAGTVAARTANDIGIAGIAKDAKIVPIRVLGRCGGSSFDITDGIRWAAGVPVEGAPPNPHPAQVINLSLGGFGPCDADYEDAIRAARARGATVIVAGGNSDRDAIDFRPANCEGVIAIAATNREGGRASFGRPGSGSNFGAVIDIAAPGGETVPDPANGILSTLNSGIRGPEGDAYESYNGTSMAAPHVAGVAALLYEVDPSIGPDEVLAALQATSRPFPEVALRPCSTMLCGAGIVDASAAVKSVVAARLAREEEGKEIAMTRGGVVRAAASAASDLARRVATGEASVATLVALPAPAAAADAPPAAFLEGNTAAAAEAPDLVEAISRAQVKSVVDKAFPLLDALWRPFPVVVVCWENPTAGDAVERGWVQDAIASTWEAHSALTFEGWGPCHDSFSGVRIAIRDEGPHVKFLGRYLAHDLEGNRIVVRDGMVLNFTFANWGRDCAAMREACIRSIAVHEFGHAIGLAHEHNRPDTPGECTKRPQGPDGDDISLTSWDPHSVMNYCNSRYNNDGRLSPLDIAALQEMYGAPSRAAQR